MAYDLQDIRDRGDAILVPMNEVMSCHWGPDQQFLATEGLNGCTAIAILSKFAGVLAHVAPMTEVATGDQNTRELLQRVIQAYNTGRQHNVFPPATSVVLAAVYQGNVALPDAVDLIKRVLNRLEIPIMYKEYRVRERRQLRMSGETSIVLRGQSGCDPEVYINNQRVDIATDAGAGCESDSST